MTGQGIAKLGKLELFLNAVWVDFSAYLSSAITITGGRDTAYDQTQPTTLAVTLFNDSGNLTPDNPLSIYFPYLIENVMCRVTVTDPSNVTHQCFTGFVDSLIPTFTDVTRGSGVVALAASDLLARVNNLPLNSDYVEQALGFYTKSLGATFVEAWPMGPDSRTGQQRNVGVGLGVRHDMVLQTPVKGDTGSYTLGDTITDRLLDGGMTFSPATTSNTQIVAQGTCPVFHWDRAPKIISMWFKIPTDATYPGPNSGAFGQMFDASKNIVCTMYWSASGAGLSVIDASGAGFLTIDNSSYGGSFKDGTWHNITVNQDNTGTPTADWYDALNLSNGTVDIASIDISKVRYMVLGGALSQYMAGDPRFCLDGLEIGPVVVYDLAASLTASLTAATPGQPGYGLTAVARVNELSSYLVGHGVMTAAIYQPTSGGGSGALIGRTNTAGRLMGDVMNELADTVAGTPFVDASTGNLAFYDGASARTPTVDVTIDCEIDMGDVGTLQFKRGVDEVPTRCSASSPAGDAQVVDTVSEAVGAIRDSSITTCAFNISGATTAASWQIVQAQGLRMRAVQLDLAGSPNNFWGLLGSMRPFMRIRLTNLPTTHLGYSYIDGFGTGWTITLDNDSATIAWECIPAGIEARTSTMRAGANGSTTLNAPITNTATTLTVLPDLTDVMTSAAGEYPFDINLNGERITLPAVPTNLGSGGSTSRLSVNSSGVLQLNGAAYKIAGANAYWLAFNDNVRDVGGNPTYPSSTIKNATMLTLWNTGVRVLRCHTVGIGVGNTGTMMPTINGALNATAMDSADQVIAAAKAQGMLLWVPLTDRYNYYHGGAAAFLAFRGYPSGSTDSRTPFYTDTNCISDYKFYINALLTHVNPYTGLAWKDDPTIAVWETGNEMYDATTTWTNTIAAYIKTLSPNTLVADGSAADGLSVSSAALTSTSIDIVGGHFYQHRMDLATATTDAATAASHSKAYVIGEYAWTNGDNNGAGVQSPQPPTRNGTWLPGIRAAANIQGSMWWTYVHPDAGIHRDGYENYGTSPENVEQSAGWADFITHNAAVAASNGSTGLTGGQVYTGVTRGVYPTFARAHNGGERVEVWNAGIVSM